MMKRWKRLAAIVGAAVLVVCQSEVFVKAAELSAGEGTLLQEEAGNGVGEAETVTVEDGNMDEDVENVEVKSIETQTVEMKNREAEGSKLLPVTNLRWNEKGQGLLIILIVRHVSKFTFSIMEIMRMEEDLRCLTNPIQKGL